MHNTLKKSLVLGSVTVLLLVVFNAWSPGSRSEVDLQPRHRSPLNQRLEGKVQKAVSDSHDIPYHVKKDVAWRLAQNACQCVADKEAFRLPFSNLLFPRVWAHNLDLAFLRSHPDPDDVKRHRAQEYSSFQRR